jgi:hypothetical protein
MMKSLVMGTTKGIEWCYIDDNGDTNSDLSISNSELEKKLDLDIVIVPQANIFVAYKEIVKNNYYHYFMHYRFAKEIEDDRSGSFYGSAIILIDHICEGSFIYSALVELSNLVETKCIENNRFVRKIKSCSFECPESLIELKKNLKPYSIDMVEESIKEGSQTAHRMLVVNGSKKGEYKNFVNMFLESPYQKSYLSDSPDVVEAIEKKNTMSVNAVNKGTKGEGNNQKNRNQDDRNLQELVNKLTSENKELEKRLFHLTEKMDKAIFILTDSTNNFSKSSLNQGVLLTNTNSTISQSLGQNTQDSRQSDSSINSYLSFGMREILLIFVGFVTFILFLVWIFWSFGTA